MAYITQYEIDKSQDAERSRNLDGVVAGVGMFARNFEENRRRAVDEKRQKDTQSLQYAANGASPEAIEAANNGDFTGMQKLYSENFSAKKDLEKSKYAQGMADSELDRDYKKSQIDLNKRKANEAPAKSPTEIYAEKLQLKDQYEKGKVVDTGELEVPGFGLVRTKDEAKMIRTAKGDVETAKQYITQMKELGKNVALWDRDKIGKINQLKQALVGKLRLPLMGPGTMTEDEFQRTVNNLGDPGAWFGTEANEIGKLDQMSGILDNNIKAMYTAAAKNPDQQPQQRQVQAPAPAQVAPQIQQKIQQYTPEQKTARLQELRMKASQTGMR